MKVKRFTARDISCAMDQVRKTLGSQAVILATGKLPDGSVEVQAAVDDGSGVEPQAHANGEPQAASSAAVAALARRVENLTGQLGRHMVQSEAAQGFSARPEMAPLYHHFTKQEVDKNIISELLDDLGHPQGHGVLPRLNIRIKKALKVAPDLRLLEDGPVIWALVGPTGVGKTTTAAKLAATFSLKKRLKVGLITVDNFRMAAAEQLKAYGRIMELPTLEAANRDQFLKAVAALKEYDVILVDTVGRSPEDEENLDELADILAAVPGLRSHLVLASPTRQADQELALASYQRFDPASLIFTKLDETSTFGPILNQVHSSGLPVSYVTNGQKVPDDLELATLDALARRLTPNRRDITLA